MDVLEANSFQTGIGTGYVLVLEENTTVGLMIVPIIRIIIVQNAKIPVDGHVATATWNNKQGGTVRDTTTRTQ